MILIEAGERSARAFEAKLLFCAQLAARGHDAVIDDATLPADADRNTRFDAATHLRDLTGREVAGLVMIGAETVVDDVLIRLRQIAFEAAAPVHVFGRFADHQQRISAQSRLAYALGREPSVIDLGTLQKAPLVADGMAPGAALPGTGVTGAGPARVAIVLPDDLAEDPLALPHLLALGMVPEVDLVLLLSGRAKELLAGPRSAASRMFGLSELGPAALAALADIAVIFGGEVPGERIAGMATQMLADGRIVIDCTAGAALAGAGAPALRGPLDPVALVPYLRQVVLPNRAGIAGQAAESAWIAARRIEEVERLLGLSAPPPAEDREARRTIFVPTNGNGLGHARRCTLIAREMPPDAPMGFAAFPSCVPLVRAAGYDCLPLVQKSPHHPAEHANDLVNAMRLRRALRRGDRVVFDGGYVFDSIYRTILDKGLEAAWIRRGLWQAGQVNPAALDRERVFRRVIVPLEAFDELNHDMSFGAHLRKIGPVVGDRPATDAAALRERLAERLGRPFGELVVSMLGGGVAADRTAQLQMLSGLMERRPDCLHLILIWPGSMIPPALFGWTNTRVCQTRSAADFAAAADLVITAAGYNSFHEVLYHGLPAIFVPQMAAYMDDQERRAAAAAERGLAIAVQPDDLLLLEREVAACLDEGKTADLRAALAAADLPARGNRHAAELLAEDWT